MSTAEMTHEGAKDTAGAMEFTGLSRTTLHRLREAGKLRITRVGRKVLYPIAELRRLLEEGVKEVN